MIWHFAAFSLGCNGLPSGRCVLPFLPGRQLSRVLLIILAFPQVSGWFSIEDFSSGPAGPIMPYSLILNPPFSAVGRLGYRQIFFILILVPVFIRFLFFVFIDVVVFLPPPVIRDSRSAPETFRFGAPPFLPLKGGGILLKR